MPLLFSRLGQQFKNAPRYQRVLGYLAALYLVYAFLLGVITPYIIAQQAPEKIAQAIGREAQLSSVSINPFTLKVTINDFNIAEPSGKSFVFFDSFVVQVNFWKSLFNLAINVEQVKLNQFTVNVEKIDEQTFNFSDILTHIEKNADKSAAPQTEPEQESTPPLIQVKIIEVNQSAINYSDKLNEALLSIPDINFSLAQFNNQALLENQTAEQFFNRYNLSLTTVDNSVINTQGDFQVAPLQVAGKLIIKELQLPSLWAFIAKQFQPALNSGVINIASDYQLDTVNEATQIKTSAGIFSLRELNFTHQQQPLIKLPLLSVTGITTDLAAQQVSINDISTNGLLLHAKVSEDGVDLAQLFQPKTNNENTEVTASVDTNTSSEPESAPWLVKLAGFNLNNYDLRINESVATTGTDWQIASLNISTGPVTSELTQPIDYDIDFEINQKGAFSSKGQVQVDKQSVNSQYQLTKLQLAQFQPYLKDKLNIDIKSGALSSQGQVTVSGNEQVTTDINLNLDSLKLNDSAANSELLSWQKLQINKLKFDQKANSISIAKVSLNQPASQFLIDKDGVNNFSTLTVENADDKTKTNKDDPTKKAETQTVASENSGKDNKKLLVEINEVKVQQGKFKFTDNSIKPSYSATVSKLNAQLGKISSTANKNAQLDIKAVVNDYAPIRLVGDVNPLIEKPYLDLNFAFDHFELPSVTPYTSDSVGLDIDEGQLNLDLNYHLEQDQLKGRNSIFVDQLDTSDSKNSDASSLLPIGLAIPLLQDSKGQIKLDVKVDGDINDPEFNVSELVLKALGNIIIKAATSPFSLLAGLVDSDEDLDKIDFSAGSSVLEASQQHKLASLAKALTQRPQIKLNIKGSYNADSDWVSLANQSVNEKISRLSKTQSGQLTAATLPESGPIIDALFSIYQSETKLDSKVLRDKLAAENADKSSKEIDKLWYQQVYQQTSKAQVITINEFNQLAAKRANAVKVYLQNESKVAASRMFVLSHQKDVTDTQSQAQLTLVTK